MEPTYSICIIRIRFEHDFYTSKRNHNNILLYTIATILAHILWLTFTGSLDNEYYRNSIEPYERVFQLSALTNSVEILVRHMKYIYTYWHIT